MLILVYQNMCIKYMLCVCVRARARVCVCVNDRHRTVTRVVTRSFPSLCEGFLLSKVMIAVCFDSMTILPLRRVDLTV